MQLFKRVNNTISKLLFVIISMCLLTQACASGSQIERKIPLAFLQMDALYVKADGSIFAAEGFSGSRIFTISSTGVTTVFAEGLNGPIDIAEDSQGNLFVTNFNNATVSKITPQGQVSEFATTLPFPAGIVAASNDDLYISHYGSTDPNTGLGTGDTIIKIDPQGQSNVFSQGEHLIAPVGITMDENDYVYTANFHNGQVIGIDENGNQSIIATLTPPEAVFAIGHIEYAGDKLYATGIQTQALYKLNPRNGNFRARDISNKVKFPNGIAYDAVNRAVVVSTAFNPVSQLRRFPVRIAE